jgi:hypothetical protein
MVCIRTGAWSVFMAKKQRGAFSGTLTRLLLQTYFARH